ncbi:hypothetical protein D3C87_1057360 [compost metagenome]
MPMPYKVAYGVNHEPHASSRLMDKFIAATITNDEETLKEIFASLLGNKAGSNQTKPGTGPEPFGHLKKEK